MFKTLPILLLLAVAQSLSPDEVDSLLSQVFGPMPQPTSDKTQASTTLSPVKPSDQITESKTPEDLDSLLSQVFDPTPKPTSDKTQASTTLSPVKPNDQITESETPDDLDILISQIFGPTHEPTLDKTQTSTTVSPVNSSNETTKDDLTCTMPDGQKGECIAYYLCNSTTVDGDHDIDTFLEQDLPPCDNYIDVCCPLSDKRPLDKPQEMKPQSDQPQKTVKELSPVGPMATAASGATAVAGGQLRRQRETIVEIGPVFDGSGHRREGCGWANPEGVGFQIAQIDGKTKFGEFPWMVTIISVEPVSKSDPDGEKLNVYLGGGSLIHPSVVLTAANFVTTAKALKVRAGEWNAQDTKEIYPFQDRDIASVEVHEEFNKTGKLSYDIAVMFLVEPVDLAPNVGVACLPTAGVLQEDGKRCFATGWGKDQSGRYQIILKKIELPVVKHDTCQTALRRTHLRNSFELHSSFMCAGGESGKGICKGDGGSPLSCPIENEKDRYVQSGVASWVIGCGEKDIPGVFVDVSVVRNWIDDKVVGKGYLPATYTY